REDEKMMWDASLSSYGYDHIGIEVEDVDAAYTDIAARGYTFFMPPKDIPNLRIAFFRGPEDITIELVQRKTNS
ncbi:MAG: VOC family protein, partial [Desulfobacterales bacterium]